MILIDQILLSLSVTIFITLSVKKNKKNSVKPQWGFNQNYMIGGYLNYKFQSNWQANILYKFIIHIVLWNECRSFVNNVRICDRSIRINQIL